MFYGSLKFSEWWCNFEIKRSKVKVTVYENVKVVFRSYPREQWIGLIYFKPAPKWPSAHLLSDTFHQWKRVIFAIFIVCIWKSFFCK